MPFCKVLILFLGSFRITLQAWMFKNIIFHIFALLQHLSSQSVSNALSSSCLYEAPPSEKLIGRLEQCVVIGQAL